MAQKMTVTLIDDLDGQPIEDGKGETVAFSIDGQSYEIDLSKDNAKALRKAFSTYSDKARKVSSRRSSGTSKGPKEDLSAAREWLRANGHEVNDRGRIPATLLDEWRAAR